MSSKALVWLAFAVWSLFSGWWYVCKIKNACGKQPEIALAEVPSTAQPEPIVNESPTPPTASAPQEATTPTNSIEKVQVVEEGEGATIHFPYNSTQKVSDASIDDYLSRLASTLTSSDKKVVIVGHTDGIGDAKTNFAFAERRAKNIRDILIEKGVRKTQIQCISHGEAKPISTNDTPEGRYQNRRVEIKVTN